MGGLVSRVPVLNSMAAAAALQVLGGGGAGGSGGLLALTVGAVLLNCARGQGREWKGVSLVYPRNLGLQQSGERVGKGVLEHTESIAHPLCVTHRLQREHLHKDVVVVHPVVEVTVLTRPANGKGRERVVRAACHRA